MRATMREMAEQATVVTQTADANEQDVMTQPTKIVRIITRLNIGGPAVHVVLLSTRLAPERFATCLIAGQPDATEGDLSELVCGPHVRVVPLSTLRRPIQPWRDLVTVVRLSRLLWRERPRIVHTHMAKAGALGRLAGITYNRWGPGRHSGGRAALVHTFHGHVLDAYFPAWLSRLFVTIERWLARRTDCLIAVSAAIRDALLEKGIGQPSQWRVIPLGLDLSKLGELATPNAASHVRFGLVGRLVPIKNPRLFLTALAELAHRPSLGRVSGLVVGDGPLRASLEQDAKRLGLDTIVQFAGWQRNLLPVYEGLDATCVTSWNEGTPVALIEAMAAARAVVATDVGGVRDLLEGASGAPAPIPAGSFRMTARGVLVRPGDAQGLAEALAAVASNPVLRQQLGGAARTYVLQRFSEERLVRDMTGLYEALLTGGNR